MIGSTSGCECLSGKEKTIGVVEGEKETTRSILGVDRLEIEKLWWRSSHKAF